MRCVGVLPNTRLKLAGVIVSKPMGRDARSLNSDPLGAPEPSMTRQHAVKIFTFALMIPFVACGRGRESAGHQSDSAFAAMQVRGQTVMGVDQYASAHVFEDLEDGGRIVLDAENLSDTALGRSGDPRIPSLPTHRASRRWP